MLLDDPELEDLQAQYEEEPYLLECATLARQWLDGKLVDDDDMPMSLAECWLGAMEGEQA